ncbi:MAG TPA: enoyl-CoA hydratase [Steroidobacteraceae bacterium]
MALPTVDQQRITPEAVAMNAATDTPYVLKTSVVGLVTLTLNRGERFNPLSLAMIGALERELDLVQQDDTVRVVVLAATGRGFSAGHDLRELRDHVDDVAWQRELFTSCARMMLKLTRLRVPVVARVHGIATAAGCQLVSMCDLAIANSQARFALPGVSIGLFCSTPAVGVVRNVGRKRAMEMLLTGDMIDAAVAAQWGLINRVVTPEQLDAEVASLAAQIMKRSARVIELGKRAFYSQAELDVAAAYDLASEAMVTNLQLDDAQAGIEAFFKK